MTKLLAIIFFLSIFIVPQAVSETSAEPSPRARIYVYVQSETPARSWFPIFCDSSAVAKLKRGRFFAIDVRPGRHMVGAKESVPVFVDAESGKEYFVRVEWSNGEAGGPAVPVWEVVPRDTASRDMIYLAYIDADEALSSSVPKTDPRGAPRLARRNKE